MVFYKAGYKVISTFTKEIHLVQQWAQYVKAKRKFFEKQNMNNPIEKAHSKIAKSPNDSLHIKDYKRLVNCYTHHITGKIDTYSELMQVKAFINTSRSKGSLVPISNLS